ncbi:MAG: 5-formyltetrahydrofolate cyclo-ligase [Azoarcus sp.]|jgi:5,10-methenyltetrahydrofolate synthetase|nr:5-formyltetrahydrofolate cyclo-ligase [Azoarcus sp.]
MSPQEKISILDDAEAQVRRATMRKRALAARGATPVERRAVWEAAIMDHLDSLIAQLNPRVLAFCWPYRAEADCRGWVERWLAGNANRVAALPAVLEKDAPLIFRRWQPGAEMAPDRHGIPFPIHGEAVTPDVTLVPLNVFDARGYRLGYGGGYFDRTLAAMRVVAVGVGFELGREIDVLPQAHDRAMHWLVTEAGVFRGASA